MKKLGIIIMALCVASFLEAHTLLMNVMNNDDDTITVRGEFSTGELASGCLLYTSPSPRDRTRSRMPSSA